MTQAPSPKDLCEAAGISPSYASMILGGSRRPPRPLAIHIFRITGWKHASIASLNDEQIATLESIEPWSPRPTPESPAEQEIAA